MQKILCLLPILVLTGCVTDDGATRQSKDELICVEAGFAPGTAEFIRCLTTAKIAREAAADAETERRKEQQKRDTISDSLASDICVDFAKNRMPHPVIRNKSLPFNVNGGYEKTVRVSFELNEPGTSYSSKDAICKIRGRDIVDFNII